MLKQRVITALLLIPIVIYLVLTLPTNIFGLLTGLIVLLGAHEWSGFMGVKKFPYTFIYPALLLVGMVLSLYVSPALLITIASIGWMLATVLMYFYPKGSNFWGKSILIRAVMGVFVLLPCWIAINFIRSADNGPIALLFLFVLIWGADSFAYFAGKKWGKHKLAPALSPGKSWEGFGAALVGSLILSVSALCIFKVPYLVWPGVFALALITVIFSVMGDLFESMLKRNAGLKDSGKILPGHGGILDRIDSLTAAAPIFVCGSILLSKFYY